MYETLSESMVIGTSQFNHGERGIKVGQDNPVYAYIYLPAENNKFGGQSQAVIEIYPRPSSSVKIHFKLPKDKFNTYSHEDEDKAEKMKAGLNFMCEQAVRWIDTFVLHLPPESR
ncbi:hypothetical protein EBZ39_13905 [bacterium]|nr:hypothetical protein [bacterium]